MRIGDASRSRRFASPARRRWYAFHRSLRFALRMMGPQSGLLGEDSPLGPTCSQACVVKELQFLEITENPPVPLS